MKNYSTGTSWNEFIENRTAFYQQKRKLYPMDTKLFLHILKCEKMKISGHVPQFFTSINERGEKR